MKRSQSLFLIGTLCAACGSSDDATSRSTADAGDGGATGSGGSSTANGGAPANGGSGTSGGRTGAGGADRGGTWSTLSPDTSHAIMITGYDAAILAASADHRLAVAYFTGSAGATIAFSAFPAATTASWVDPVSGETSAVSGSPFANSGSATLNPPASNSESAADWVLELRVP